MPEVPYRITIEVQSQFIAEQSEPDQQRYVFSYSISLHNVGQLSAQLLTRHWIITNGDGLIQHVKGSGVIGVQPTLAHDDHFRYSSSVVLSTPVGTMQGSYQMRAEDGQLFDAQIPLFRLAVPGVLQ